MTTDATLDDYADELTGADAPTIGQGYTERTHRAHTRYAASEQPGVVWFDRRDGREDYSLGKSATLDDLNGVDDRELLRIQVRPFRQADETERYVVQRSKAYIHEFVPVGEHDETERSVETCAGSQVFDSLAAAREHCCETVAGYADAPRRDAVLTEYRNGGETDE